MNDKLLDAAPNEYRMPRRTGIWLLLASLLVNFFVLGLLVAPMLRPHSEHPSFGPPGNFIDHLTRDLSPADAEILRKAYVQQEPVLSSGHQNIDAAMAEVSDALRQPTVDDAALQKAISDVAAAHAHIQAAMEDLIKHAAADLSPEGRRIFAENGLHPPHSMSPMGGNRPPPPGMGAMPPPD